MPIPATIRKGLIQATINLGIFGRQLGITQQGNLSSYVAWNPDKPQCLLQMPSSSTADQAPLSCSRTVKEFQAEGIKAHPWLTAPFSEGWY